MYAKGGGSHGGTGYPMPRLLALVACGTRTVVDAVFGPTSDGETTYARTLLRSMRTGMIVLMDRGFASHTLVTAIAGTGADVLVRVKNGRKLPVLRRFADGSYLSRLGATEVRLVVCEVTVATGAGRRTGLYTLNYLYAIAASKCRLAIIAMGLDPGMGFLHNDPPGRDSLVTTFWKSSGRSSNGGRWNHYKVTFSGATTSRNRG